jgi:hypothetical protein
MKTSTTGAGSTKTLGNLDPSEDFLKGRYQEGKSESEFRQYDAQATPEVAQFYRMNHEKQTVDYALAKEKQYFENEKDKAMLEWVRKFNPYDLYSKGHTKPDLMQLKPYYDDLFAEFLPEKLDW